MPDHGLGRLPAALQLLGSLVGSGDAALGAAGVSAALLARPPPTLSSGIVRAPEPDAPTAPLAAANGHHRPTKGGGGKASGRAAGGKANGRWEVGAAGGDLGEATLVRELLL